MSSVKKFTVSSTVPEKRLDYIDSVFADMKGKMTGTVRGGLLLAGDPGVGKTSFVRQLSQLLGIKLVLIETPHLVEEHIINIPFIVYHPESKSVEHGQIQAHKSKFDVKLADSDLFNQVMHAKKVPDQVALAKVLTEPNIKKLHEALGGSDTEFPDDVKDMREHFNCILFLDEYYRETSTSIRNMLRGILNGNLGLHTMPKTVYVIYASNMNDEGVEGIALNQDYSKLDFDTPGKSEWFSWFVSKYTDHNRVKLNMDVVHKFFNLLDDEHLSHDDANADVRVSPRRWEQLLLLLSSSLPVSSDKEARVLMSQVHVNFRNYTNGAKAELLEKVSKAVSELIKETSNIEVTKDSTHPVEHWRDVLKHQLEVKMKLAEHRSYIPVISGLPGIGKTSHIYDVALELGLVPVVIEVDKISPEDVIGLPLTDGNDDEHGNISVKFSEPALYKIIKNKVREGEKWLKEYLQKHRLGNRTGAPDPDLDMKAFEGQEHKYLIFFDELNRASTKVFNALRRVLLDKTFVGEPGHEGSLELPKGSIIVAAINPVDTGTTELTKHMRDVLDIIPTGSSWHQTVTFLKSKTEPKVKATLKNPEIAGAILDILIAFYQKFQDPRNAGKHDGEHTEFHMNLGSSNIYLSPREIEDLYTLACHQLDPKVSRFKKQAHEIDDPQKVTAMAAKLKNDLYKAFRQKLSFTIEDKHGVRSPHFWDDLEDWFMTAPEADKLDLVSKKAKVMTFDDVADAVYKDPEMILAQNIEFTNYLQNVDPGAFKQDFYEFLINRAAKSKEFLLDATNMMRELDKADRTTIKHVKDEKGSHRKVSKFEHLVRELVHAIYIHNLSKEFIAPIKRALIDFLGADEVDTNLLGDLADLNQQMTKYINGLDPARAKK